MRSRSTVVAAACLVALTGCGASEEEAVADLQGLADDVMSTGAEVVDTLESAGLEVDSARGAGDYCQTEPAPGLTFAFGGRLTEAAAYDEQFAVALDALLAEGWEVASEGDLAEPGEAAHPWANLERDTDRLSLDRTVREGSDALVFGLDSLDDCIRVPDGSVRLPDDLEEIVLVE